MAASAGRLIGRFWRNRDLQPNRRQGPLSGSCEADLNGRNEAQSCRSQRGQWRSPLGSNSVFRSDLGFGRESAMRVLNEGAGAP